MIYKDKIIDVDLLTSGKRDIDTPYIELAKAFISRLVLDYIYICRKLAKDYEYHQYLLKQDKYMIERFVEKDSKYDALTFGLIHRDAMLKKLEEIRKKYNIRKEKLWEKQNQDTH